MGQTYIHIATFLVKHKYFGSGLFKSISISCVEDTVKLIRDLDIVMKPFSGGISILSSNPELLNGLDHPIRMYLNCKDPFYINYTELPTYNLPDTILYFNNLTVNSDPKSEDFNLHEEEFVGQNEVVQLCQRKIKTPSFDQDKTYLFRDTFKNEISNEHIGQSTNNTDEFLISNWTEGLVSLVNDTQEVKRFYHYPGAVRKKPLGIVEIYTGELLKLYKEYGKIEYVINFVNRQTIWKYFLVSPVYQKFDNLSIINKEKEQVFNAPKNEKIHDNTKTLVFESKNKLPLSEFSDDTFQLVDNYNPDIRSGKIIIKNLIKASPEQLYRNETTSDESMYSHIYL